MNRVEYFTLYFVYLFIAKFVLVYVYSLVASVSAIRTTKTLRLDFLQCLLLQDISFFDSKEGGNSSVKVTTNGYHTQHITHILVGIMLIRIETTSTTEQAINSCSSSRVYLLWSPLS